MVAPETLVQDAMRNSRRDSSVKCNLAQKIFFCLSYAAGFQEVEALQHERKHMKTHRRARRKKDGVIKKKKKKLVAARAALARDVCARTIPGRLAEVTSFL